MKKVLAGTVQEQKKLQNYLRQDLHLTKRQISQAKFRRDGILVNGQEKRVDYVVKAGDQVEVVLEEESTCSSQLLASDRELQILYEDEDLLMVNKAAGVVVHPSHGHYQDSLSNDVAAYFQNKGEPVKVRPIGRLDKETSGIVVFAKNQTAAARLAVQKEKGIFRKKYVAFVQGMIRPVTGKITFPIAKQAGSLMKMDVSEQGMCAVTHYRVLNEYPAGYSLVELQLETGRTHQIRVHMKAIGHPLLGDRLYKADFEKDAIGRAALHASECNLEQPFSLKKIVVASGLPEDMENLKKIIS